MVPKKKGGRPALNKVQRNARLLPEQDEALRKWIEKDAAEHGGRRMSVSDAMRYLIVEGLNSHGAGLPLVKP